MKSLIKLAENPLQLEEEKEGKMVNNISKGRTVRGPRTKLSMAERIDRMERNQVSIAKALRTIAKGLYGAADDDDEHEPMDEPMDDYDEDEDPMAIDDIDDDDEDELSLDDDEYLGSDFAPYGGEKTKGERPADDTEQDEPEDVPGVSWEGDLTKTRKRRVGKAKVSKDDSSSNFGEKDDDIPGNRQLVPDKKNKDAGEYLIQGGSGDGQSAFSKAQLQAIANIFRSELRRASMVRKAEAPGVGTRDSKIEKGVDQDRMFDELKKRSFKEINALRVEIGDL
jgi:hypothetical protein